MIRLFNKKKPPLNLLKEETLILLKWPCLTKLSHQPMSCPKNPPHHLSSLKKLQHHHQKLTSISSHRIYGLKYGHRTIKKMKRMCRSRLRSRELRTLSKRALKLVLLHKKLAQSHQQEYRNHVQAHRKRFRTHEPKPNRVLRNLRILRLASLQSRDYIAVKRARDSDYRSLRDRREDSHRAHPNTLQLSVLKLQS